MGNMQNLRERVLSLEVVSEVLQSPLLCCAILQPLLNQVCIYLYLRNNTQKDCVQLSASYTSLLQVESISKKVSGVRK